jgi:hypothetical protein
MKMGYNYLAAGISVRTRMTGSENHDHPHPLDMGFMPGTCTDICSAKTLLLRYA